MRCNRDDCLRCSGSDVVVSSSSSEGSAEMEAGTASAAAFSAKKRTPAKKQTLVVKRADVADPKSGPSAVDPDGESGTAAATGAVVTHEKERMAVAKRRLDELFVDDSSVAVPGPPDRRKRLVVAVPSRAAAEGPSDPRPAAVVVKPAAEAPPVSAEGQDYAAALLEMLDSDDEDKVVDAGDACAAAGPVAVSSVVPAVFSLDVKELIGEGKETLTFVVDAVKRVQGLQASLDSAMAWENQLFPGDLTDHTLVTRDGSAPTLAQLFQLRRAYHLKGSWLTLHARLYSTWKMLSEAQATLKGCNTTIDFLSRVYNKELVVTGKEDCNGHGDEVAVVQEPGSLKFANF